jgi:hypothetical protein
MKLTTITNQILLKNTSKALLEAITGDASIVQKQLFSLGNELKADGEDVTDDEVQAALLGALIDADGKVDNVDVSDVEAIKQDIKESRTYIIQESGVLHSIELAGTILGNAALLHALAGGLSKVGIKVDENSLKQKIEKVVNLIKKVTGFPAKMMEKAFMWISKKLGFSQFGQKVAGLSGVLIITVAFLALAIYLFPSVGSGLLLMFAISGMIGKTVEIAKILKEIWEHVEEELGHAATSDTVSVIGQR